MHCCNKYVGGVLVVLGVLFLLRDLDVWNFFNISWWTVMFLGMGICSLVHACCSCGTPAKNGKKK